MDSKKVKGKIKKVLKVRRETLLELGKMFLNISAGSALVGLFQPLFQEKLTFEKALIPLLSSVVLAIVGIILLEVGGRK